MKKRQTHLSSVLPKLMLVALFAILGMHQANAQSVEYVIFEVSDPSTDFTPGKVLKEGDLLNVPENVELKLISKTGEVLTLNGPLEGTVTNDDGSSASAEKGSNALLVISELVFNQKDLVSTLGAARSLSNGIATAKSSSQENDPWVPTLSTAGNYCMLKENPSFKRINTSRSERMMLIQESGKTEELKLQPNTVNVSLSDLIGDDLEKITAVSGSGQNKFVLHLLEPNQMSVTEQIGWMAENGCSNQAMNLLKSAANLAVSK